MILKTCQNCGSGFRAKDEYDHYCGPCRGLPKEDDAVIYAIYGIHDEEPEISQFTK